jgi:uncharacterized protein (TIGR02118 family)
MQACLFLFSERDTAGSLDIFALQENAARIDGLSRLIVHEPVAGEVDPRITQKQDAPSCVLQWYFEELAPLEAALEADGAIHRALHSAAHTALSTSFFTQQIMAVRTLAPPHAAPMREHAKRCTYLVAYEGPADDFNAWLAHYLRHHPPLMLQLPGLRELEIYTHIDSTSGLPFGQALAMQRNKVVFDDFSALADALASPVRDAMRRDFHALPPHGGATPHYAMRSTYVNLATY